MQRSPIKPLSWRKVGLAVLPGVFFATTTPVELDIGPLWSQLGVTVVLVSLVGAGVFRERHLPLWSFPAVGLLFSMLLLLVSVYVPWRGGANPGLVYRIVTTGFWVLLGAVPLAVVLITPIRQRRRWGRRMGLAWGLLGMMMVVGIIGVLSLFISEYYPMNELLGAALVSVAGALAIMIYVAPGTLLARKEGALAGLAVVSVGALMALNIIDPDYGLWDTPWANVLPLVLIVSLTVISPAMALRARSLRGQAAGMLLPAIVALVGVALLKDIAQGIVRGLPFTFVAWVFNGILVGQMFLSMALAVALYHQMGKSGPAAAAQRAKHPPTIEPEIPDHEDEIRRRSRTPNAPSVPA